MSVPFSLPNDKPLRDDNALIRGYRMINKINIQNFRCFENIELSDCRRINVIVGRNASGKTALLEALFLASGASPELVLRIKNWRGEPIMLTSAEKSSYEALWKDLFHRFKQEGTISIRFTGSSGFGRSLTVSYETAGAYVLALGEEVAATQTIIPIRFTYEDEAGNSYVVSPVVAQGELRMGIAQLPAIKCIFFTPQNPVPVAQFAGFFSELSKKNQHSRIVDLLREEFPFVQDITIEESGGMWTLHASVKNLPEKLPLTLVSGGVNKIFCLLLAIAQHPRGLLIVDEVENGLYFDTLPSIWKTVLRFAQEYEVQLFATTHSNECLQSLKGAMKGNEEHFALIRIDVEKGEHKIEQFYGKTFLAALKAHGEVR